MVTLLIKVVFVIYMVPFFEKPVNALENSTTSSSPAEDYDNDDEEDEFDFRAVIEENSKYPPMIDKCPLRIVGGMRVDIEEIPYQIVIRKCTRRDNMWVQICGGVIITQLHVITAAHCFSKENALLRALRNLRLYRVVAGTSEADTPELTRQSRQQRQRYSTRPEVWKTILNCFQHAFYSESMLIHDFAVLELASPVPLSKAVQPIPMLKPSHGLEFKDDEHASMCLVSGFGLMKHSRPSQYLRMVCVPFIPWSTCRDYFGDEILTRFQFCAGDKGKDSCEGDSGGPITYKGYLIGIVSYGGSGCGESPGVYTRISSYTSGAKIPFSKNHCVTHSVDILRIFCLVILILVTE